MGRIPGVISVMITLDATNSSLINDGYPFILISFMLPLLLFSFSFVQRKRRKKTLPVSVCLFSLLTTIMTKDKKIAGVVYSSLTLKSLEKITAAYHVSDDIHPTLPNPGQAIHNPPDKMAGVYHHHLKAGLRFPLNGFITSLLAHYHVHLTNGFRKVMCFLIICKMLDIIPTVDLFRYFYVISPNGDWLSFSKRINSVELCLGLPSSIKNWKPEFFFVDSSVYGDSVTLGNLAIEL